ncbi:DUF882 domain-containing protein [Tepidamorphus sp. 3E244]|uniref:DUF882 domain-containing protein n=1 Tax=Tepidamorphus sp. 3E244 TaxID=3385498 RepID=UPI0038FD22E5
MTSRAWRAGSLAVAIAFGAVMAITGFPGSDAEAESTRTLTFKQMHTGETQTITYKRNGRFDSAALKKVNYMLRDWRRNESTKMDPRLIDLLWEVKQATGSTAPVHVLSGYRSPVTNNMLRRRSRGVAKNSQHTLGKACDFYLPDVPLAKLRATAMRMQRGGVGYYPTSGSPFVHLDVARVRAWPRMTRQQLVKLFPDGETLHLPSDGKPLSGYAKAKAKAERGQLAVAYTDSGSSSGGRTLAGSVRDLASAIITGGGNRNSSNNSSSSSDDVEPVANGESWSPPEALPMPRSGVIVASADEAEEDDDASPLTTAAIPLPRRRPLISEGPSQSSQIASLISQDDQQLTALARADSTPDFAVDPLSSPQARQRLASALAQRASEMSSERTIGHLSHSTSVFHGGQFASMAHPSRDDPKAILTNHGAVVESAFAGPVVVYAQPTGFAGEAIVHVTARKISFASAPDMMSTASLR